MTESEVFKAHTVRERNNVEQEFYGKSLDDYVPQNETETEAKNAVAKMISEEYGNVVLLGSNGVGKTMLASIAARELGGKIYTMYEISAMIRQAYTVRAERTELEIVQELASLPFLAIDELGRTKGSASEQNWLSFILDKRHTRGLPFMLLSNGHFSKDCKEGGCQMCFENFVGSDIKSRLQQNTVFIAISAPDGRRSNPAPMKHIKKSDVPALCHCCGKGFLDKQGDCSNNDCPMYFNWMGMRVGGKE